MASHPIHPLWISPCSAYEKRMTMRPSSSPDHFVEEYFPSWNLRVNIGVGITTALNFLHTINKPKSLIHGDVKRYITMPPHMQSPSSIPATTLLPMSPHHCLLPSPFVPVITPPLVPSSLTPPLPSLLVPFITASSPSFSPCPLHHCLLPFLLPLFRSPLPQRSTYTCNSPVHHVQPS